MLRRKTMAIGCAVALGVWSWAWVQSQPALAEDGDAAKPPVSFAKDIAPILIEKCLACHGATQPKGGYQLHTFENLLKPGDSSAAPATAKDPNDSELLRYVEETDKDSWMPKDGDRHPAIE